MDRVVILGGGASGVLLALQLLRGPGHGLDVVVVERRAELGAGVAYATRHPDHLLNVRAANMSAVPDEPGHFAAWLAARGEACGPDDFAPRRLYAAYLAELVAPLRAAGRLRHLQAEALSVRPSGAGVTVRCRDGAGRDLPALRADVAAVATGNEGPPLPAEPWRHTGWGDPGPCRVPADAPVVVVGTGLTMVDRVLWLLHDGHRGPITAVSRHGLLPRPHRAHVAPAALPEADLPATATTLALTRWLRARVAAAARRGTDWRAVLDGLRPHTQALWRRLDPVERRRFLRHAAPLWNVHRHRIAPVAAERIAAAEARGQFHLLAGRVSGFAPHPGGVTVSVVRRGGAGRLALDAAAVFECRGRAPDVARSDNPLLGALLADGLARPDPLGLGLDVTPDGALVDPGGRASDRIFGLGPVTAGTFWEITAVPDIRAQAARLAGTLLARASALPDRAGHPEPV